MAHRSFWLRSPSVLKKHETHVIPVVNWSPGGLLGGYPNILCLSGALDFWYFHPYFGKIPHIFQRGWFNYQQVV